MRNAAPNGCNVFGMLTELRTGVDAVVPRGGGGPRRRARAVGRAVGHPHRDQTTNTPRIWHAWHHDVRRAAPVSYGTDERAVADLCQPLLTLVAAFSFFWCMPFLSAARLCTHRTGTPKSR